MPILVLNGRFFDLETLSEIHLVDMINQEFLEAADFVYQDGSGAEVEAEKRLNAYVEEMNLRGK